RRRLYMSPKRAKILAAALLTRCWPPMARSSNRNGVARRGGAIRQPPTRPIRSAITGSARIRCSTARATEAPSSPHRVGVIGVNRSFRREASRVTGKVLVVDDDKLIRQVLRRLLERRYGCLVQEATDGQVALGALEADLPDLVLLDVSMPNVTGPQLLEKLRADPRFARLPVAMITAVGERETVVES